MQELLTGTKRLPRFCGGARLECRPSRAGFHGCGNKPPFCRLSAFGRQAGSLSPRAAAPVRMGTAGAPGEQVVRLGNRRYMGSGGVCAPPARKAHKLAACGHDRQTLHALHVLHVLHGEPSRAAWTRWGTGGAFVNRPHRCVVSDPVLTCGATASLWVWRRGDGQPTFCESS
jgi:hypothetical protein